MFSDKRGLRQYLVSKEEVSNAIKPVLNRYHLGFPLTIIVEDA
jgi:hypothetical protein